MGRRIEFDYDRAIERATQMFWKHGYSNTSLRALLKVMGIGEGSFYNTLKSKRNLYLECLKHYNDTVSRRRLSALMSGATPQEGVRSFFRTVLDDLAVPSTPRVCLLAGSLASDVLETSELSDYVVAEVRTFEKQFCRRLEEAKKAGTLPADFDAESAAGVLVTFLQGLFRVVRALHDRAEMERQIEVLLEGLHL